MVIKELEFMPVIIGGDINAYSIARAFHEEYQIRSLVISKSNIGPTINSKIIITGHNQTPLLLCFHHLSLL